MNCQAGICSASPLAIARLKGDSEPRLVGTGRSLREVAAALAADPSEGAVARRLGLDRQQVALALHYLERHPDVADPR